MWDGWSGLQCLRCEIFYDVGGHALYRKFKQMSGHPWEISELSLCNMQYVG